MLSACVSYLSSVDGGAFLAECPLTYQSALVAAGTVTAYCGVKAINSVRLAYERKKIIRLKLKQRDLELESFPSLTPDEESRAEQAGLGTLNATELVERLQSGDVSSELVLRYYANKARDAQRSTNCLAETQFRSALKRAKECDEMIRNGQSAGPMHGLPVSIKENIPVQGCDSTVGVVKLLNNPNESDCTVVQVLRESGAIPFCTTNVPQTLLAFETANPIYGVTTNPHDKSRCPGGSSGGEAALIQSGGSPLGIGSDIGGSVRIPAHFCGISGFKPTAGRISMRGVRNYTLPGQDAVKATLGPMANCVDDLVLMLRQFWTARQFELDPVLSPLPFNEEQYGGKITPTNPKGDGRRGKKGTVADGGRKMTIGYYVHDGHYEPSPACQRAVLEAVEVLRQQGHDVVEFVVPNAQRAHYNYVSLLTADGGDCVAELLEGDEMSTAVKQTLRLSRMLAPLRTIFRFVIRHVLRSPSFANLLENVGEKTTKQTWKLQETQKSLRYEFADAWKKQGVDVVLCPAQAFAAVPHGDAGNLTSCISYTTMYNVLDFPSGVVPVTKVTAEDTAKIEERTVQFPGVCALVKKGEEDSEGLPIGVQVVAPPWMDEVALRVMKQIETGLEN